MSKTIFSLLFLFFLASLGNADCFRPNGTTRNTDPAVPNAYQPCSKTTTNSMCCRTGDGNDQCRDDGLCSNGALIWRESCTDSTWKSDACIKLCVSDTLFFQGDPYSGTDVKITECDNGSLCCGEPETAGKPCCQQGKGVWLVQGKVYNTNPSSTSSSALASSTSASSSSSPTSKLPTTLTKPTVSPSSNPSVTPSNQASPSRDYTGVIAGSAVGGIVVLALLICFLWWFTFHKKRSHARHIPPAELDSSGSYGGDGAYKYAHSNQVYHEAPVDAGQGRAEMPGYEAREVK